MSQAGRGSGRRGRTAPGRKSRCAWGSERGVLEALEPIHRCATSMVPPSKLRVDRRNAALLVAHLLLSPLGLPRVRYCPRRNGVHRRLLAWRTTTTEHTDSEWVPLPLLLTRHGRGVGCRGLALRVVRPARLALRAIASPVLGLPAQPRAPLARDRSRHELRVALRRLCWGALLDDRRCGVSVVGRRNVAMPWIGAGLLPNLWI